MSDAGPGNGLGAFGELAVSKQLVSPEQIRECLEIQQKMRDMGIVPKKLGEILVEKGYLTADQAQSISTGQDKSRRRTLEIPGYELVSKLGQGGMGSVYKARQVSMERDVAIKILPPKLSKDKAFVDRFMREARAVARLNHENIIAGIDFGNASGYYYFVMEYVEGVTARSLLKNGGTIPEEKALDITLQMARALEHAYQSGMVHRDVKPENIMLARDGIAKLCDLGLAKEEGGDSSLTQTGMSVGTPHYISPEQAKGREDIDIRTDIYSLGASLYHMLTGTLPYEGNTPAVVMTKHVSEPLEPPKKRSSKVSEGSNNLIMKMMEKDRDRRYQTPADLIEDIQRVMDGETLGRGGRRRAPRAAASRPAIQREAPAVSRHVPRRSSNNAAGLIIAAGIGLLLIVGFIIFGGGGKTPPIDDGNNSANTSSGGQSNEAPRTGLSDANKRMNAEGKAALAAVEKFYADFPDKWKDVYSRYVELEGKYRMYEIERDILASRIKFEKSVNALSLDAWTKIEDAIQPKEASGELGAAWSKVVDEEATFPYKTFADQSDEGGPAKTDGYVALEEKRDGLRLKIDSRFREDSAAFNKAVEENRYDDAWATFFSTEKFLPVQDKLELDPWARELVDKQISHKISNGELDDARALIKAYGSGSYPEALLPLLPALTERVDKAEAAMRSQLARQAESVYEEERRAIRKNLSDARPMEVIAKWRELTVDNSNEIIANALLPEKVQIKRLDELTGKTLQGDATALEQLYYYMERDGMFDSFPKSKLKARELLTLDLRAAVGSALFLRWARDGAETMARESYEVRFRSTSQPIFEKLLGSLTSNFGTVLERDGDILFDIDVKGGKLPAAVTRGDHFADDVTYEDLCILLRVRNSAKSDMDDRLRDRDWESTRDGVYLRAVAGVFANKDIDAMGRGAKYMLDAQTEFKVPALEYWLATYRKSFGEIAAVSDNSKKDPVAAKPTGDDEEEAQELYKKLVQEVTKTRWENVAKLLHELDEKYSHTEYYKSKSAALNLYRKKKSVQKYLDEMGSAEPGKNEDLAAADEEPEEKDDTAKGPFTGILEQDVDVKKRGMIVVEYEFEDEDELKDWSSERDGLSWREEETGTYTWNEDDEAVDASGTGTLRWKGKMQGDVSIEYEVTAEQDTVGVGALVHDDGDNGYGAATEVWDALIEEAERNDRDMEWARQAVQDRDPTAVVKVPFNPLGGRGGRRGGWGGNPALNNGSKRIELKKGKKYTIKVVRKGDKVGILVNGTQIAIATDKEFNSGHVSIWTLGGKFKIDKVRIEGTVDLEWAQDQGIDLKDLR